MCVSSEQDRLEVVLVVVVVVVVTVVVLEWWMRSFPFFKETNI